MGGIQLCKHIRQNADMPIIFIHNKSDSSKVVETLQAGGDDHMKQQFELKEIRARIQTKLRRRAVQENEGVEYSNEL